MTSWTKSFKFTFLCTLVMPYLYSLYLDVCLAYFDQLPKYLSVQEKLEKAKIRLEEKRIEIERGLDGWILDTLNSPSAIFHVRRMCLIGKYEKKFCEKTTDKFSVHDVLELIKSDDYFEDDHEILETIYNNDNEVFMAQFHSSIMEVNETIRIHQKQQDQAMSSLKRNILWCTTIGLLTTLEVLLFVIVYFDPTKISRNYLIPFTIVFLICLAIFAYICVSKSITTFVMPSNCETWNSLWWVIFLHLLFFANICCNIFDKYCNKSKKQNVDTLSNDLRYFCTHGFKDKVRKLCTENWLETDINQVKDGCTPLHLAIRGNHAATVQVLFKIYGDKLDTSIRDSDGFNALDLAVYKRSMEMFKILFKHSSATNISSLKLAVNLCEAKIIRDLISKIQRDKIVNIIKSLVSFCNDIDNLKDKTLSKNRRKELEQKIEHDKTILIKSINMSNDINESDFICPICQKIMESPLKIYSCSKDHHLFCSTCLNLGKIMRCLDSKCMEDFTQNIPNRRYTSERLISSILESKI